MITCFYNIAKFFDILIFLQCCNQIKQKLVITGIDYNWFTVQGNGGHKITYWDHGGME